MSRKRQEREIFALYVAMIQKKYRSKQSKRKWLKNLGEKNCLRGDIMHTKN
ncbi:MAG: hypothetical protein ACE5KZ_08610 [Candidatus Scalinduaceae bacterium]